MATPPTQQAPSGQPPQPSQTQPGTNQAPQAGNSPTLAGATPSGQPPQPSQTQPGTNQAPQAGNSPTLAGAAPSGQPPQPSQTQPGTNQAPQAGNSQSLPGTNQATTAGNTQADLTDLEENVIKVTKKMCVQLARLTKSYACNPIIPEHLKKIFQNIMNRCHVEINYLLELNFSDRRQTALRLMVEEKLDMLRKEISKLKKIVDDIHSMNKGTENHVCRDVKNFYSQVGRRNAF